MPKKNPFVGLIRFLVLLFLLTCVPIAQSEVRASAPASAERRDGALTSKPMQPLFDNTMVGSAPTVISWRRERLDVFARSNFGFLLHWEYDGSAGWNGPEKLGGDLLQDSDIEVVSWGPSRLDVFAIARTDGTLQHWWTDGSGWSGPSSLGGNVGAVDEGSYDIEAVSLGSGRLDVFALGRVQQTPASSTTALLHWRFPGGWPLPATVVTGLDFSSHLSVVSSQSGQLDVFLVNRDGNLTYRRHTDTTGWSPASLLNYQTPPDHPASAWIKAVSWGSGRLDLFAIDYPNQRLLHWWKEGTLAWAGPEMLDQATSPLNAISMSPGRFDVVAIKFNEGLQHWGIQPPDGWLRRVLPTAVPTFDEIGESSLASWGDGRLDLFAKSGPDLLHWWYPASPSGQWGGPERFLNGTVLPGS